MGDGRAKIDKEKCKGCVLCTEACPQKILEMSTKVNKRGLHYVEITDTGKCTGCALCALVCPDCAIEIGIEKESAGNKKTK